MRTRIWIIGWTILSLAILIFFTIPAMKKCYVSYQGYRQAEADYSKALDETIQAYRDASAHVRAMTEETKAMTESLKK